MPEGLYVTDRDPSDWAMDNRLFLLVQQRKQSPLRLNRPHNPPVCVIADKARWRLVLRGGGHGALRLAKAPRL